MLKASEVMTHTLATCAPDASVAQAPAIMRDRNIGNVLIVEDGKLRGIVTDRDLALQVLTGKNDPLQTPIKKFMKTQVVTGKSEWSLEKVAQVMAKHQIRRLPIEQGGQLVGIISLGDVALHGDRKDMITKSLKAISTSNIISRSKRSVPIGRILGLSLTALATTVVGWLTWNLSGRGLRKQLTKSELYHTAQQSINAARDKVNEAVSGKPAHNLRQQVHTNLKSFSAQLPTFAQKPKKRKLLWFS